MTGLCISCSYSRWVNSCIKRIMTHHFSYRGETLCSCFAVSLHFYLQDTSLILIDLTNPNYSIRYISGMQIKVGLLVQF